MGSHPPGVTWHLALWSPDFPLLPKQQRLPRPTLNVTVSLIDLPYHCRKLIVQGIILIVA